MSTPEISREEEELYEMSDEELEAAFKEAKNERDSEESEESTDSDEEVELDEEDLEQPEEDSDSDDSTDDDTEEEDDEESEEEEGEPDEELDEDEEDPEESEDEVKEKVQPVQKQKFKANNREYEFTDEEILNQFPKVFGQAMDYTKKMQALKPWRKSIDALEGANLSHDDVNLMIDVLKGDKDAINSVLSRTGVDALDLDTENVDYTPNDYGRDEATLAINEVVEKISGDTEYETTHKVLSKDWDDNSWSEMTKNPELIEALHIDVKSGVYDKVQAIADTYKLQDGGKHSDLDYYKAAGQEYYKGLRESEASNKATEEAAKVAEADKAKALEVDRVKKQQAKQTATKKAAAKRKAAAPSKKAAGNRDVVDYLNDNDEKFDEWYDKLQANL